LVATLEQFLHCGEKFFLDSATQATISQFNNIFGSVVFIIANLARSQQFPINADFAKLIDDNGYASSLIVLK
jgi:hypothetical protein